MKIILLAALAIAALPGAGAAWAAGTTELDLLGKDPGNAAAYSCFTRHYDAPHLAAHPRQNVTNMSVFVESSYDKDDGRSDYLVIGVNFRRSKDKPFEISGGCSTAVDGLHLLNCGGDCDGGHFDITTKGMQSILVSIPDGVRIWDPNGDDSNGPADPPKGAEFGKDDKLFRLDRADLKACSALMSDDAKAAIFGTAAK